MSAKAAGTSPDYIQVLAQRDELLEAAKAALEWTCSITNWEDGTPYVNGRYDSNVQNLDTQLRQAIAACEKA